MLAASGRSSRTSTSSWPRRERFEPDLAERLTDAAGLRNLLVHDYGEIDHQRLWATLGELDDLRDFAKAVEAVARDA